MNDYYETRKATHGRFVPRTHDDFVPCFPIDGPGFLVVKNFVPRHTAAELREIAICEQFPGSVLLSLEPETNAVRSAVGIHDVPPFDSLCQGDGLYHAALGALGGHCYIHQSRINFKRASGGSGWHWHSDFETWHAQDGMIRPLAVTVMIPLEDNTAANGPLTVIPGSHATYWSAPRSSVELSAEENFADQREGVPSEADVDALVALHGKPVQILCEAGDAVFFDCNLLHRSDRNESGDSRTNLFVVFNRADNQLTSPFSASKPRPIQMGSRP
jgi:ectoine hydroxylase